MPWARVRQPPWKEVRPTFRQNHWALVVVVQLRSQLTRYRKRKAAGREGQVCKGLRKPPESSLGCASNSKKSSAPCTYCQQPSHPQAFSVLYRETVSWKNGEIKPMPSWYLEISQFPAGTFLPNSQEESCVTRDN